MPAFGGFDINRGLQAGQQLYGEGPRSGLGIAIKGLTDRAKMLNELALKSKFEVATQGAIEREKGQVQTEQINERMKSLFSQGGQSGGGPSDWLPSEFDPATGHMKYISRSALQQKSDIEIAQAGQKDVQTRMGKLKEAVPILRTIEGRVAELPAFSGAGGRVTNAPGIFLQKATQSNPNTAAYSRFITGIRPQLSRTLGDVANLSEAEQEAAMGLLPNEYDNSETKATALSNFYEFIVSRIAFNTGISKEEAAQQLGVSVDPVSGRITSSNMELIRSGKKIPYQSQESGGDEITPDEARAELERRGVKVP